MARPKKYFTDEERKAAKARYRKTHKAEITEYQKKYHKTKMGRALQLIADYRKMDRRNGFGDCIDFDARWIVENIFTKSCPYCGKTDWHELGCNRIDNNKPHTKDNVEPCCTACNIELFQPQKRLAQIDAKSGKLIQVWNSTMDARRGGYTHASSVANGKRKQDKGSIFKFI